MSPPVVPAGMKISIALLLAFSLIDCHQINDPNCGIARAKARGHSSRIVGGYDAKPGRWPWQVLLRFSKARGPNFCGGSVIGKKFVLTAAHCVMDASGLVEYDTIVAGAHFSDKNMGHEQYRGADGVFVHPGFNHEVEVSGDDIALIKVDSPFEFNQWVRPVCLPKGSDDTLNDGVKATLTGWGQTSAGSELASVLQQVDLTVSEDDTCRASDLIKLICSDGGRAGVSACFGDSGGPFVYNKNKRWVQHGVFSLVAKSCDNYTYFTRTSEYLDWISSTIENNNW